MSFGPAEELAELFQQQFTRARFAVLELAFKRLYYAGPELLHAWWAQAQSTALVEHRVQAVPPGGLPLVGTLDLHTDGYHANVVDYKTATAAKLRPAPSRHCPACRVARHPHLALRRLMATGHLLPPTADP